MVMGTRCDKPEPKNSVASYLEQRLLLEDNDSNVLFSVTLCSLILKPRSASELRCDIIRIFLTTLDKAGYLGNPKTIATNITLFQK